MMKYKAVLFDLGETLFNYGAVNIDDMFQQGARLTYDYLNGLNDSFAKLPSFKRYYKRHIYSIKAHVVWSYIVRREFDARILLRKRARAMRFKVTDAQLEDLCALWYDPLGRAAQIEEDLPDTLGRLREMGLKLAIVSNTFLPPTVLDRHLERFGLIDFFDARVYSSETIARKPDPRIYQHAMDRLNVTGSETVMVGDKLLEDVKGPGKLGITGFFKRGIVNAKKKVPDWVPQINHISELPARIKAL